MKLRDYQIECIEEIHKSKNKLNLVMSSVGSGKTVIFSKLASDAKGRVLIVTPSTELREQAEEKLIAVDPDIDIGSVQADMDDVNAKIVVSTRQSLTHSKSTRLSRMLEHGEFEYLIVDEAHQAPKQIKKILNQINKNIKTIAFTATPYTKECVEMFGQPIFRRTILDMIDAGFLVEPHAILVQSKTNISHVKTTNGDFSVGELEAAVNNSERNRLIVESYKKYASDRKLTLVFAAGCDHGKELLREFSDEGIACAYVDGETSRERRKEIIDDFKNQKIKVLINVMALTTGFDVPATDCVIISRPSKSRILFEQIVGRGLRLSEGKLDCLLIDIQDVVKKHDLMDFESVFSTNMRSGETLRQAKKRNEEEKLELQRKKEEAEQHRKELEKQRQQELEIVAQRIKLINRDMKIGFQERKFDWFRCDNMVYGITYAWNQHYAIENVGESFQIFNVCTDKENRYAEFMMEKENAVDAIEYIEKKLKLNTYTDPKADWKLEQPSDGQRKYCSWAKTKRDADIYMTGSSISGVLKKYKV